MRSGTPAEHLAAPDAELLVAAREGDRHALAALLERHQAQIYRFGMKMCRDPEDAKDVLQETLLAAARGIRDFRGASSLSTWLYTIARSFCIKQRRRSGLAHGPSGLEPSEVAATDPVEPTPGPDVALAGKQVERVLEQAIRALEPSYREVLILRDVEGLKAPEVAEVLGLSVAAVKSRLHRARLAVRDRVAPLLGLVDDAAAAPGACPDVLSLLSRHLEDEIGPEVCVQMERHLEGCPRCRDACDSLRRTLALCRAVGTAAQVPPAIQRDVKRALSQLVTP